MKEVEKIIKMSLPKVAFHYQNNTYYSRDKYKAKVWNINNLHNKTDQHKVNKGHRGTERQAPSWAWAGLEVCANLMKTFYQDRGLPIYCHIA